MNPTSAAPGRAYLNVGCGAHFSPEWTNVDLHARPGVLAHDLHKPLPFSAGQFDAVYSSHVLEHLTPAKGEAFLREQVRVLRPGGICRVVVPDLELICRGYLQQLEQTEAAPTPANVLDYRWAVFQVVDQLARDECGGEMLKALQRGEYNPEFLRHRFGDEFAALMNAFPKPPDGASVPAQPRRLQALRQVVSRVRGRDARSQGEAHRWMYDRLSLRLLLTQMGLTDFRVVTHLQSRIPDWEKFHLDTAQVGSLPRKPDSLFVEAAKPN